MGGSARGPASALPVPPVVARLVQSYLREGATVVEFGAGAGATPLCLHCRLISIDHSEERLAAAAKGGAAATAIGRAPILVHAPLVDLPAGGESAPGGGQRWYDPVRVASALDAAQLAAADCLLLCSADPEVSPAALLPLAVAPPQPQPVAAAAAAAAHALSALVGGACASASGGGAGCAGGGGAPPPAGPPLAPLLAGLVVVAPDPGRERECAALLSGLARALGASHAHRRLLSCSAFVPRGWLAPSAPRSLALPCALPLPPAPPFTGLGRIHEGFIPQGSDLETSFGASFGPAAGAGAGAPAFGGSCGPVELTLQEAVEYCHAAADCLSFTYRAPAALYGGKVKVWFKTTARLRAKPNCGWFAYIKGFPADKAPAKMAAAASAAAAAAAAAGGGAADGGAGGGSLAARARKSSGSLLGSLLSRPPSRANSAADSGAGRSEAGGPASAAGSRTGSPPKPPHALTNRPGVFGGRLSGRGASASGGGGGGGVGGGGGTLENGGGGGAEGQGSAALGSASGRRYLVFTSAGDAASLHKWFEPYGPGGGPGGGGGRRTWDCCVVYYGNAQKGRWSEYADLYLEAKGGKFENLLTVYKAHPRFVSQYDAVMVMDDDVGIDTAGINRCFELREQFDLWLLQPAFDPAGKISHGVTRLQPGPTLRFTNFIEMTCPLFEKAALDRFMAVYDPDLKGWGADWWFLQVHGVPPQGLDGKVAVADIVPCINPHDAAKPGQMREITKLQGRDDRVRVWERMKATHKLIEWPKVQFSTVWLY